MPNPNNARKGEQWDTCMQCGFLFPMSRLVMQKGLLICTRRTCFDNLEPERREQVIQKVLGVGTEQEGVDLRTEDRAFFHGFDEEVV